MSDPKDDATEALDNEQLSKVSGGAGDALMEPGVVPPRDSSSGKRKHLDDIVVIKDTDKSTP